MVGIGTDSWTSPNHTPFVAFTVHLEVDGEALTFLLDMADLPKSHSGDNLATACENVLKDFDLEDRVSVRISTVAVAYRHCLGA